MRQEIEHNFAILEVEKEKIFQTISDLPQDLLTIKTVDRSMESGGSGQPSDAGRTFCPGTVSTDPASENKKNPDG